MNNKSLFKSLSAGLVLCMSIAIQSAENSDSAIERAYGKSIDRYIVPIREAANLEQASIDASAGYQERIQSLNTLAELQRSYEAGEKGLTNHINYLRATQVDAKKIKDALDDLIKKQEAFIAINKNGQELIKARIKEIRSASSR